MFGYLKTVMKFILFSCLLTSVYALKRGKCLTGQVTDVQNWVDEYGALTEYVEPRNAVDLSLNKDAVRMLRENLIITKSGMSHPSIRYLSLARCELGRVPQIFNYKDSRGKYLYQTVEYVTFFGNPFRGMSSPGIQYEIIMNATQANEFEALNILGHDQPLWAIGFQNLAFIKLKELDLRACSIEALDDYIFQGMPSLEALYLGENIIQSISDLAFAGLNNLVHLDISLNAHEMSGPPIPMLFETTRVFDRIPNLRSLDLSHTRIHSRNIQVFQGLNKKLQRLSLCWSFLPKATNNMFKRTSLKYLDISGNFGIILGDSNILKGLEESLQILYATDIGLENFDVFENLSNLEVLKLTNNDISRANRNTLRSLRKLQVLDLDRNRFTTWFKPVFSEMNSLQLLTIRENSINIISQEMVKDVKNISYIALGGINHMVCNCHSRDLIEMASQNELRQYNNSIELINAPNEVRFNFQNALQEFNNIISARNNVSYVCEEETCLLTEPEETGRFLLIDYDPNMYLCLASNNGLVPFTEVDSCNAQKLDDNMNKDLNVGVNLLLLLIIPGVLLPTIFAVYLLRRKIWYFYVTMRNSATLSLISKDEILDENKIYNYDVFVSYCQDDRTWMLDQLLPHVETDCSVKVCLHERDFQVGLSILENIVSCMDKSKTIMLVISKKFLKSQWCQFEMHLAQHRLLETRREDLILVLLEEIPRRLRPNTLHYLMLTKTYIVWPQADAEKTVFWRRLKKSLLVQKNKFKDDVVLIA